MVHAGMAVLKFSRAVQYFFFCSGAAKLNCPILLHYGVQRFVPSEFGNEADRSSGLPPFQAIIENKRKIRRATEAAGIAYTCLRQLIWCLFY